MRISRFGWIGPLLALLLIASIGIGIAAWFTRARSDGTLSIGSLPEATVEPRLATESRPVSFPPDALQDHPFPLDGAHAEADCEGCHTEGTYKGTAQECQDCHPGGALSSAQWSNGHAKEARRTLGSCQSCHPDGDACLACHSAKTGLMISPHPANWGKIQTRFRKESPEVCAKCH